MIMINTRRPGVIAPTHIHLTRITHRAAGRIAVAGHRQAAADLIAADWEHHQAAEAAIHAAEAEAWTTRLLNGSRWCDTCGITRLTVEQHTCPLCTPPPKNGARPA